MGGRFKNIQLNSEKIKNNRQKVKNVLIIDSVV